MTAFCRYHNKTQSQYGMIIVVDIQIESSNRHAMENDLSMWLTKCIQQAHMRLSPKYNWEFVKNRKDRYDARLGTLQESWQVCLHFSGLSETAFNHCALKPYTKTHPPVCPKDILANFVQAPRFVRLVAASGVDERHIRDQWAECIKRVPYYYSYGGGGSNSHPCVVFRGTATVSNDPRHFITPEFSFSFDWPDYPGYRGDSF